jgi:ribonuclease HI
MDKKIGFIGAGNMGSSLIKGFKKSGSVIYIIDKDTTKVESLLDKKTKILATVCDLIKKSDTVIICVKPNQMDDLLKEIGSLDIDLTDKLFISIAAGRKIDSYEKILKGIRFIRVMPNMPASIALGMTSLFKGSNASDADMEYAKELFGFIGKTVTVQDESLMNVTTAVAGSGPAFVFMFVKALQDAAIGNGIPADDARIMACQTVIGSASYVLEDGRNIDDLIKSICSPNGTTIEGVNKLNAKDFVNIVKEAVEVTKNRSIEMSGDVKRSETVEIYTDGACQNNPGPGGYGAILIYNGTEKEISGYREETTNNEMELTAAVEALKLLKKNCDVVLYSDSSYLVNAFNEKWVDTWKSNGWVRDKNGEVKNLELWKTLDAYNNTHRITWMKVKGHSDNKYNNRCDKLARDAIKNKGI